MQVPNTTISDDSFKRVANKICNSKLIASVQEYLAYVKYLHAKWDNVWFRGVSKASYDLKPGVYRESGGWVYDYVHANDIYHDFMRVAIGYSQTMNRDFTEWEWLHLMQHHGLPTRVLDWTYGALIGLYFAVRNGKRVSSPSVWLLDPYWLNQESTGCNVLFSTHKLGQQDADAVANLYIRDHIDLPQYPIAIDLPNVDPRIAAQRSCFTIHGNYKKGMERLSARSEKPRLIQLRLKKSVATEIRDDLHMSGISESTLFPDLDGLTRDLKIEMGLV